MEPLSVTVSIMSPPKRNGDICRRSDSFPYSTRTERRQHLVPEKARKSQPSDPTSTGMHGTDWAASTRSRAPASCAIPAISATGLIVPRTFETWVQHTSRVRCPREEESSSRSSPPSAPRPMIRRRRPASRHSACHGTKFEWCSMIVMTTWSPRRNESAPLSPRHRETATRFSASVVFRRKTISRALRAPTNLATPACACSYIRVAVCPSAWGERWMFALKRE